MHMIDWEAASGLLSNSYAILYRPNFRFFKEENEYSLLHKMHLVTDRNFI